MLNHVNQGLLEEFLGNLALDVDVDLLFAKGVPEVFLAAVVEFDFLFWGLVLPLVNQVNVLLGWAALTSSFPELFPADEEVAVLGIVVVLLEVLVHFGLPGDVVDHEVKHQVVVFTKGFHVVPVTKGGVDNVVTVRGKATVTS